MARIRTIKPEFWEDELIGSLSREARLLFLASLNLADDDGRLRWSAAYIKASAFIYDDDIGIDDAQRYMDELVRAELFCAYRAGKAQQIFAYIVGFQKHQKISHPSPSRLPEPPSGDIPENSGIIPETSGATPKKSPRIIVPSTVVPSNGKRKRNGSAPPNGVDPFFETFWSEYPKLRRKSKAAARKAWAAAIKKHSPEDLISSVREYAKSEEGCGKFVKLPSSWLNEECWNDDRASWFIDSFKPKPRIPSPEEMANYRCS